jgi:hypothetical protein
MSKLSKQKAIKRKRHRRSTVDKTGCKNKACDEALKTAIVVDYNPVLKTTKRLKINIVRLKNIKHLSINVAGFRYQSAADFCVSGHMHNYWGTAMEITRDIHGNFIVYRKERFPLFDDSDYRLDGRHFRLMLICSSQQEAEDKMGMLLASDLDTTHFGHDKDTFHTRFEKKYRHLLPYVYYEDSVRAIAVETLPKNSAFPE